MGFEQSEVARTEAELINFARGGLLPEVSVALISRMKDKKRVIFYR